MVFRRVMSRVQPILTVLLPLWFFFGGGFRATSGWQVLLLGIGAPILFIALIVLALIVYLRPGRTAGAVDWVDAVLFVAVDVMIVIASLLGDWAWLTLILLAVVVIGAIGISGWRFVQAGKTAVNRMHEAFMPRTEISGEIIDGGEYTVIAVDEPGPATASAPTRTDAGHTDDDADENTDAATGQTGERP